MASPRYLLALMATFNFIAVVYGGPLGPLPNVTNADMGLKEGSCALGDVVYLSGDEFPGSSLCERCTCRAGSVHCTQQQCEPRPGCKALHRPDHCCPTYQCECEQEGRVYGNGEKLVDPLDPCRVCYCQGGEVVCRRIACFVRDDCTPRLVPGRCCPEYDNCPLRGVTSLPSMMSSSSISPVEHLEAVPLPPKEFEQKITIKEITPVSEIPVITDVKIKEILPSPSNEVAEYSSSKSPLIPREATSEKTVSDSTKTEVESPSVIEVHPPSETTSSDVLKTTDDSKTADDAPPSKFSLSTQDSINSEIYPSKVPIVATMGMPLVSTNAPLSLATTIKSPVMEEEDPSLFVDHNPAFPPLPDDLSVLSNHGDELIPEPSADTEHIPIEHAPTPEVIVASVTPTTESESKELLTTTSKFFSDISETTTERSEFSTDKSTSKLDFTSITDLPIVKENPLINLRSAIPTEILSAPSEEITAGNQETSSKATAADKSISPSSTTIISTRTEATTVTSTTTSATTKKLSTTPATTVRSTTTAAYEPSSTVTSTTAAPTELSATVTTTFDDSKSIEDMSIEDPTTFKKKDETATDEQTINTKIEGVSTEETSVPKTSQKLPTDKPEIPLEKVSFFDTDTSADTTTLKATEPSATDFISTSSQEQTTSSIAKSNVATEVTSQTELSSLPIETSDQNPHEASENVSKESLEVSTGEPLTTVDKFAPSNSEVITVSRANDNDTIDKVETTEFILTSFGSSESATDAVELIKIAGDTDKSASIIDSSDRNKNALTDLIKLVSDVASISDTHSPVTVHPLTTTTISVDSEELIPVNAGYKSKNSNFNQNSITEMPSFKSKTVTPANKQKIVEIEDDDGGNITDQSPPNDKAEPTTRRPIIDNVSDDKTDIKSDKKDIEIITQSYVPTINRRPTKVILKEENSQELPQDDAPAELAEAATEDGVASNEFVTASVELGPAATGSAELATTETSSAAQ